MTGSESLVIAVVGAHTHIGGRLATCLAARGASAVALTRSGGPVSSQATVASTGPANQGVPGQAAQGVARADGSGGSGAAVSPAGATDEAGVALVTVEGEGPGAVVAAVERAAGGRRVAGVVHAEIEAELCGEARLGELPPGEWRRRCAQPIDSALWTARAGFELMAAGDGRSGQGGVLGFVCPTVGLTGAAGHVAMATTSEAIRLLAKSAARRWGPFGITSNAFAPGLDACHPPAATGDAGAGMQVHATALDPASVDPVDDIASLVLYLAGPGGARLTGATLGADGGELMAP